MLIKWLQRCFRPALRYIERDDDSEDERLRKALLFPLLLAAPIGVFALAATALKQDRTVSFAIVLSYLLIVLPFLIYMVVTKSCPQHAAGLFAVSSTMMFMAGDFWTFGWSGYYAISVLAMDILLLCNCDEVYNHVTFYMTLAVIIVNTMEQAYGTFGLYDVIPQEWSGYDRPSRNGGRHGVSLLYVRLLVFCADFSMTRYFSKGMREQRERVEQSVLVAQRIALALARFDLHVAQEMVEQHAQGLPPELHEAFTCLLVNLRSYRPYLPQSCLPGEVETSESDDIDFEIVDNVVPSQPRERRSLSISAGSSPEAVVPRQVTLVQVNVRCFMKLSQNVSEMVDFNEKYISLVLSESRGAKGLVEHVHCDRVLVSFNAARVCSSHRMQGLHFADRVKEWKPSGGITVRLSMAVSSGETFSGPLGCDGLRSYSLVGLTAAWVPLLERMARKLSVTVVSDSSIQRHTSELCLFRLLGTARFEKASTVDNRVFEFLGVCEAESGEEWMYQLGKGNPWGKYNEVKCKLIDGDPRGARALLGELDADNALHQRLSSDVLSAASEAMAYKLMWEVSDVGMLERKLPSSPFSNLLSLGSG